MLANSVNVLALATIAANLVPAALAVPVKVESTVHEDRSLKAIGTAVAGGIASGTAGAVINKYLKREAPIFVDDQTGTIYADIPNSQVSGRSLKAIGTAVAGGIASGTAGAVINKYLKREAPIYVDDQTGTIYADIPNSQVSERSLKAIGTAVAGGIASGTAGAVINKYLKRESTIYVDDQTGTIYADLADSQDPSKRSLKAIGTAVAGGIASGTAGAVINKYLKRESPIYVDDQTGTIYADIPNSQVSERSLKAIGTAVAGGIASGTAGAVINKYLKRESSIYVDDQTGTIYADIPDSQVSERSLKAIGTAVAGGIASGTAGAVINKYLKREAPIYVDDQTGTIYADLADSQDPSKRSLKAIGTAVAGGIASGTAGAVINKYFKREVPIYVDDQTGTIYADLPESKRSLKAVGTAVAAGIAGGAAGALAKDLVNNLRRDEVEVEERSLKAIGTAVATGIAGGAAGALAKDLVNNLRREEVEERSLKAVGTAVAAGIAGGAAGALAKDLVNNLRRDEVEVEARSLKAIGTAVATGIAGGAAGALAKDLVNNLRREEVEERSLKAIGTAVVGGIAGGAAGALAKDLVNNLRRDIDELD